MKSVLGKAVTVNVIAWISVDLLPEVIGSPEPVSEEEVLVCR